MSNQLSTLSAADIAEFKTLEAEAIELGIKIGKDSREFLIRTTKIEIRGLWRAQYKTREEFVEHLAGAIGRSGRTVYRMLEGEKIRFQVTKLTLCQKDSKSLAKTVENMPNKALAALVKAPPSKQVEVLKKAASFSNGAITEKSVAVARKVVTQPKEETVEDEGGTEIPRGCWQYWEQRDEFQKHMTAISHAKCWIDEQLKSGNKLLHMVSNSVIADLSRAYQILEQAKPSHVCTVCQGRPEVKPQQFCDFCGGSGLLAHWRWKTQGNPKLREIQEKAAALKKRIHATT